MPGKQGDLVPGTLEMLVLKTLALQPMHGFGISMRIEQMSNRIIHVIPGSLFPALNRERGDPSMGTASGSCCKNTRGVRRRDGLVESDNGRLVDVGFETPHESGSG